MPSNHENRDRRSIRLLQAVLARLPRLSRKTWLLSGAAVLIVLICFLAGSWYGQRQALKNGPGARKILYYVDPMNPAHTTKEPGLAPCGMKMEPVYADEVGDYPDSALAPGSVRVTPRKQQLIGMRVAPVEKAPFTHTLRTQGKVAVDTNRIYRLNASVNGWIRQTYIVSTGALVMRDQPLASFYSPEFLGAQQAYLYALHALDRFQASGRESPEQLELTRKTLQQYIDSLENLGMSQVQIKEIAKTRAYTENIMLVAPATSFILASNVSAGQRFDAGVEFYQLADLSRVWVEADVYEHEAYPDIRPGAAARVVNPYQKKVYPATVSKTLPQFDPKSRTMKVRLEVGNPDFVLRPDMFVDVEFAIDLPAAVHVPVDAVLDSGGKQTVFVDRGEGLFEPRKVETGWRFGDRVQIRQGLQPGEKIVISGNFLIDSESRMKLAAAGIAGEVSQDPVCSKYVEERKAGDSGLKTDFQGKTYYFCSEECKRQCEADPARYLAKLQEEPAGERHSCCPPDSDKDTVTDPVCGMQVDPGKAREAGLTEEYQGKTYSFCVEFCKEQFARFPERYLSLEPTAPKPGERVGAAQHGASLPSGPGATGPERMAPPTPPAPMPPGQQGPGAAAPQFPPGVYGLDSPSHREQVHPNLPPPAPPVPQAQAAPAPHSAGTPAPSPTPAPPGQQPQPSPGQHSQGHMDQAPKPDGGSVTNDPVCGHKVVMEKAKAAKLTGTHQGQTFYFCSDICRNLFEKNPGAYAKKAVAVPQKPGKTAPPGGKAGRESHHD